jgi:hypothetical protein
LPLGADHAKTLHAAPFWHLQAAGSKCLNRFRPIAFHPCSFPFSPLYFLPSHTRLLLQLYNLGSSYGSKDELAELNRALLEAGIRCGCLRLFAEACIGLAWKTSCLCSSPCLHALP